MKRRLVRPSQVRAQPGVPGRAGGAAVVAELGAPAGEGGAGGDDGSALAGGDVLGGGEGQDADRAWRGRCGHRSSATPAGTSALSTPWPGSLFIERPAEVAAARDAFDELSAHALSREDTLVMLTEVSAAYQRRCSE